MTWPEHARRLPLLGALLLIGVGLAGCNGSKHNAAQTTTGAPPPPPPATGTTTQQNGPGALQAEANSAAAGDIPDNQVFLVFHNRGAHYSMKYPEGWAQRGSGKQVVFRDKNNIVRIVVGRGTATNAASVRKDIAGLLGAHQQQAPQTMTISGRPAVKVVYGTESAPNAVTGKRVQLVVDRYYLWKNGRLAVVDLGTPQGVDNVDAYRLMIESFRWS
jgi:hypothetical protein